MADETKLTAATRLEKLLDNIAGGENEVTPATRLEKFLSYIADAMEGGESGGNSNLIGIQLNYDENSEKYSIPNIDGSSFLNMMINNSDYYSYYVYGSAIPYITEYDSYTAYVENVRNWSIDDTRLTVGLTIAWLLNPSTLHRQSFLIMIDRATSEIINVIEYT